MSDSGVTRVRRHWREGSAVRTYVRAAQRQRKTSRLRDRMLRAEEREAFWQLQEERLVRMNEPLAASQARRRRFRAMESARKLGYRYLKTKEGRISRPWWM